MGWASKLRAKCCSSQSKLQHFWAQTEAELHAPSNRAATKFRQLFNSGFGDCGFEQRFSSPTYSSQIIFVFYCRNIRINWCLYSKNFHAIFWRKKKEEAKRGKGMGYFFWKHEINFSDNHSLVVNRVLQKICSWSWCKRIVGICHLWTAQSATVACQQPEDRAKICSHLHHCKVNTVKQHAEGAWSSVCSSLASCIQEVWW